MHVLSRLDAGTSITELRPYLLATMRNLHRQRLRRKVETCDIEDLALSDPPDVFRQIACAEVRAAILRLPQHQARLVMLILHGETSPQRLADLTQARPGTVMSRLARARQTLKSELGLSANMSATTLFGSPDAH